MHQEPILILDIGTRKIAAIALLKKIHDDNSITADILDTRFKEHEGRAVRAGLIHDIEYVSSEVSLLKNELEKSTGFNFKKTATAIAGRNLKIYRHQHRVDFFTSNTDANYEDENLARNSKGGSIEINREKLLEIEKDAITDIIKSDKIEDDLIFAGYTVSNYILDGENISKPVGHYCRYLELELIATFLPRHLLESIFAVFKKNSLELSYLTLEPIAAEAALLTDEIKHIPMLIIDIGGGTSDIAIISKGAIQSFAMIPTAGDFITEQISTHLITDFNEAERIKRIISSSLHSQNSSQISQITYKDIFGENRNITPSELLTIIKNASQTLSDKICTEILKFNSNSKIILLTGGGALTPFLEENIASKLNIPRQNIGIRQPSLSGITSNIFQRKLLPQELSRPESTVALGLSILLTLKESVNILHLFINSQKVEVANLKGGNITVLEALLNAGFSRREIFGKPGLAVSFTLNGNNIIARGEMPQPAQITVNNKPANLDTIITDGDRITFAPAISGKNASPTISDYMEGFSHTFTFNNQQTQTPLKILINGKTASSDTPIRDNDIVEITPINNLVNFLNSQSINPELFKPQIWTFDLLGQTIEKKIYTYRLIINGREIPLDSFEHITINSDDVIYIQKMETKISVGEIIPQSPPDGKPLKIKINGEEFIFPGGKGKILVNGKEVDENYELTDGDIIRTMPGKDAEAVVVDLFKYISIDPQDALGKKLKLLVNDFDASFTTPLIDGADVKITFDH